MPDLEWTKIIPIFIAGFFGAFIAPLMKFRLDKRNAKKSSKLESRPALYEMLVHYLLYDECDPNVNLGLLKSKLLVYGKDDVIELSTNYMHKKAENNGEHIFDELYVVIKKIRTELEMGTDFNKEVLQSFVELTNKTKNDH
ncbi:hypothetical protein CXF85_10170 [Colwellia sp. 75C3]|uniref:hypothetical protein n=1 Tax=Colwellia sp. 75C3 TaxID=888425 RepID=UPI000C334970|nr:hypothetical protein [Colwellia sp. 75C3]PKG83854.1 hypothetical protein CXF85_10170 [Colwellia sp. 75C3]